MKKTMYEKIWEAHLVRASADEVPILYIDTHLVHEVTSPQAFEGLRLNNRKVRRPDLTFATMDHNVPTTDRSLPVTDLIAAKQMETLAENCAEFDVPLYDIDSPEQGIVHVIGPELGITLPGKTIVCGDSHTSTHGALGALAFGIGTSEIEHVLATQCLIPYSDLPEIGERATLSTLELPNPYEMVLKTVQGETVEIPWDFARHYCDELYRPAVEAVAMQGRHTLGQRIRRRRKSAGLSQDALARAAGIGRVTLVRLENGEQSARFETLGAVAIVLGVGVSELLVEPEVRRR